MKKDWLLVSSTLLSALLVSSACSLINAPSEIITANETGGSGGDGMVSVAVSTSSSSTSSSSSGIGGSGGGMMICQPSSTMPCYDGTPGTANVGTCQMGVATCLSDGTGYGPCDGQVTDIAENCDTPLFDENCDGLENEGCPGQHLGIVAAAPPGYADDVRNYLMATGSFELITIYDASVGTPALVDLQTNQSVLVFSDKVFFDPVALGDVLADYYDGGGRVVLAIFSTVGSGNRVQGRFGNSANPYMITDTTAGLTTAADDALGTVIEPQNRLMRNVAAFNYKASVKSQGGVINSGVVVAEWASGLPLVVRGMIGNRNRVDVNFYPPQTQSAMMAWTGDGAIILRNAVLF